MHTSEQTKDQGKSRFLLGNAIGWEGPTIVQLLFREDKAGWVRCYGHEYGHSQYRLTSWPAVIILWPNQHSMTLQDEGFADCVCKQCCNIIADEFHQRMWCQILNLVTSIDRIYLFTTCLWDAKRSNKIVSKDLRRELGIIIGRKDKKSNGTVEDSWGATRMISR